MKTRHSLIAAALAAVIGALIVPALAQGPGGPKKMPDRSMGTADMGGGMMSGGMMSDGKMGGCATMMQSMNGANGRPNSQWQKHPPGDRSMPN
jgi:hypothetical protein